MKKVMAKETLLAFPDFSKEFTLHADASKVQLGAVISQEGRPIAFCSRKLNPTQTRHTVAECKLLSIVETLKEFRSILYGQRTVIHTDHKNLVCKTLTSDRVMRWQLCLEEFSPELHCIPGEDNSAADALSCLPINETLDEVEQLSMECCSKLFMSQHDTDNNPLSFSELAGEQSTDKKLKALLALPQSELKPKGFHGGGVS